MKGEYLFQNPCVQVMLNVKQALMEKVTVKGPWPLFY